MSTTLKWLGGKPVAGILNVRQALLQECHAARRGEFSQKKFIQRWARVERVPVARE